MRELPIPGTGHDGLAKSVQGADVVAVAQQYVARIGALGPGFSHINGGVLAATDDEAFGAGPLAVVRGPWAGGAGTFGMLGRGLHICDRVDERSTGGIDVVIKQAHRWKACPQPNRSIARHRDDGIWRDEGDISNLPILASQPADF